MAMGSDTGGGLRVPACTIINHSRGWTVGQGSNLVSEALIDQAEEIGLRDAGAYLQKFGRYPMEDDTDNVGFHAEAWQAAWLELQRRGADEGLYDSYFEALSGRFLGTQG
jgi:hypothetical protein